MDGLIINDEIMYKTFEWNGVAITTLGEGLYYTASTSKLDVSVPGYSVIGVSLIDWLGVGGMFGFYHNGAGGKISAYSGISQTITKLIIMVIYKRN